MKSLLITALLVTSFSSLAVDIQCAKLKRFVRPVSKDAIRLAKFLKVKTCSGQRFKNAVVYDLKSTIKMVRPTKEQVRQYGLSKSNAGVSVQSLFN